jgi:hypothetical protein
MKYLFCTLAAFTFFFCSQAQNCLPDSIYRDSATGVYPRPVSSDYPNAGINKKACINKPYDFVFTVVVPDSITISAFPFPLALEKIRVDSISNLPKGIGFLCNPANCIYKKNTFGCMNLHGTPTAANTPGDYKPIIHLTVTVNFGIPLDYAIDFPGPIAEGEYILTLLSEVDCVTSSFDVNQDQNNWYPNPSSGILHNNNNEISSIRLYNINGTLIYENENPLKEILNLNDFDLQGMYILRWIENNKTHFQRIIFNN